MTNSCTLVVTGAPLTSRCPDVAGTLQEDGWRVNVVATPSAAPWLDADAVEAVTGQLPLSGQRQPTEAKRGGEGLPAVVVVCPATFNTIAKAALGIADSYAHGVLCEAIGAGVPVLCVPMINDRLWGHPALAAHLATLSSAGVEFLHLADGGTRLSAVPSGTGGDLVAAFDPDWVVSGVRRRVTARN